MRIIAVVSGDGCAREKYLIKYWRKQGARLTNITEGGEGTTGWKHSSRTLRKMSKSAKKRGISKEQRQNMLEAFRNKKWTKEEKERLSQAHKGKHHSLETRKRCQLLGTIIVNKKST